MIRKAFILIGIFVSLQLIFFACCKPDIYFSRITDLKIANYSLQTELGDSLSASQNDFRIRLRMEEAIAIISHYFFGVLLVIGISKSNKNG